MFYPMFPFFFPPNLIGFGLSQYLLPLAIIYLQIHQNQLILVGGGWPSGFWHSSLGAGMHTIEQKNNSLGCTHPPCPP